MFYYTILGLLIFNFNCISSTETGENFNCDDMLDSFSYAVSNFTYCSLKHARPISLCENCVNDTILMIETHKNLTKKHAEIVCIDNFINLDRLQVVNTIYKNAIDLWTRARCNECFMIENGTLTYMPSEVKQNISQLFTTFKNCTDKNWDSTNKTKICANCIQAYTELNDYYFKVGDINHGIDGICMDIVDLMNKTQGNWSITCCKYRVKSEFIYIVTTVFMCILPILFYVLIKLLVDIKRPILLPQNRFAESINTPSTSFRRAES